MKKDYYLGLDIGTNSVGWAVTDEEYNLCEFRNKAMWGIRLFEDAETAADRRTKRNSRRRLSRKKQRIDLLQELFAAEIAKVDPTFFLRLNESRLHLEDKKIKELHPLFIDKNYSDIEYYKEFPTIFHLRKELIENKESHDIRLVYLALHHILKTRGHFLIDGKIEGTKDFVEAFDNAFSKVNDELELDLELDKEGKKKFEEVLRDRRIPKSVKQKNLKMLFYISKTDENCKEKTDIIDQFCKLAVGMTADLTKFFMCEKSFLTKEKISYSSSTYEDDKNRIDSEMPEKAYLIDAVKPVYDWNVLVDILGDEEYISYAKVKQYETHKENLRNIRTIIKKYCSKDVYKKFFNDQNEKNISYSSYVGYVKKNGTKYDVKKTGEEDFYKELGKILSSITPEPEDEKTHKKLIEGVELAALLPIQRSKDNGVIPHQVHELELEKILDNAAEYYDFLKVVDESGKSVKDKIISIFEFRVPYYVGPLSDRHKNSGSNAWIVRKEEGRIYPWNFDDKVDLERSNEEFINRMTNKCTYLVGEDVLPKNSLLYSKFMVLNELNNLAVKGKKVSVETKKAIFNELFKNKAKVTGKSVAEFLQKDLPEIAEEDLSGFDQNFHTSLKSYLDFKKQVFGDDIERPEIQKMVEDIIKWKTIYDDDRRMIEGVIKKKYPGKLTDEQIKKIHGFRYSGWGNFSNKFLAGIYGTGESGEAMHIIDALWETNNNLMQLLSENFKYRKAIDDINAKVNGEIKEINYESVVKDLYVSPANKRAIWQTIKISEEIKKIMGCEPKKIFVEMARGEEKKEKGKENRKNSRKQQLLDLYAKCEEDARKWTDEISKHEERDFNSMKLYLYYTQMGKCMYTGEKIDLDELMQGNSKWDRDHIYPQSKIKDDSIDNLVLVNKTENAKKTNEMLSEEIQKKNIAHWSKLLNNNLISKKKYDRLTRRGEFTDDELAGFISRQLVETRQSSKAVAEVFKRIYKASEIIYVKSALASDFRKRPLGYLKSRRENDYHHAKEAYLNIVVGNVYNAKFTPNPVRWMKENKDKKEYSLNAVFYFDVKQGNKIVWEGSAKGEDGKRRGGTIERIRKIVQQDNVLYTEYTYCEKGELFNATIKRKGEGANIQLKLGLDTSKYGGYYSANTSYFSLIELDGKKGERVRNIIGVPIYISNMLPHNPNAFLEYCEQIKGLKNVEIVREKIKKNSILVVNGFPMRIRGEEEKNIVFKNNIQLKVDEKNSEIIRKIEKYLQKNQDFEFNEKIDGITEAELNGLYDVLLNKLEKIYAGRPSDQSEKIRNARKNFIDSKDSKGKIKFLNEVLNLVSCKTETAADLSFIGAASKAGKMTVNKNTIGASKLILINQSVTGLFENREEL